MIAITPVLKSTEVSRGLKLAQRTPKLRTLVCGSAFDAAVHDAFGKAHGLNCYHTYTREFMNRDLGAWLVDIPGVAAIESNPRQYCPVANAAWVDKFPGIFKITDGMMDTGGLTGPGLGATSSLPP
jgi:hypothetical protein